MPGAVLIDVAARADGDREIIRHPPIAGAGPRHQLGLGEVADGPIIEPVTPKIVAIPAFLAGDEHRRDRIIRPLRGSIIHRISPFSQPFHQASFSTWSTASPE